MRFCIYIIKIIVVGYTERRSAGWCRQAGWDAAWRWLGEIPPASFAGSPPAARSHNRDKQTPCSAERGRQQPDLFQTDSDMLMSN